MSVSSVNGVSAVSQQQEQVKDVDYKRALEITSRMNDEYVSTGDIKTPFQVVASVGFAGFKTFLTGASTFAGIDFLFQGGVSGAIKSGAKKGLEFVNKAVTKLETGASSKVKDFALKGLKGIQEKAPKFAEKFGNKLPFLAGLASIALLVPAICTRDNNGDGIKDIAQKSQSAYDNFEKTSRGFITGASEVASLMQVLS